MHEQFKNKPRDLFRKLMNRSFRITIFISSLPCTLLLIMLFPFIQIRFVALFSDRIGHYAMNTQLLLCFLKKNQSNKKTMKYIFYTSEAPVCNDQLHKMWKRVIYIFPFPRVANFCDQTMHFFLGRLYKNDILEKITNTNWSVDREENLKKNTQTLSFDDREVQKGRHLLSELGIPLNAHFVCILVRDSVYLSEFLSGSDWSYHDYRDCHIENFSKAALFLANKGYYVIRMGKAVSSTWDIKHPNIIDYANHPMRSDFGDIYFSAHCAFFVSTSSGLDAVAQIFRKPILLVNVPPFRESLDYWYPCEYFILKKVFDIKNNKFVSLNEIQDNIDNITPITNILNSLHWQLVENTEDEILEVVQEMEGAFSSGFNRQQQNLLHPILHNDLPFQKNSTHDLFLSNPEKFYIKIGSQFFKKNTFFFDELKTLN